MIHKSPSRTAFYQINVFVQAESLHGRVFPQHSRSFFNAHCSKRAALPVRRGRHYVRQVRLCRLPRITAIYTRRNIHHTRKKRGPQRRQQRRHHLHRAAHVNLHHSMPFCRLVARAGRSSYAYFCVVHEKADLRRQVTHMLSEPFLSALFPQV